MLKRLFDRVTDQMARDDRAQAQRRVAELCASHPEEDRDALAERLIRRKCVQAGAVGAVTSAGVAMPGLGAITALTVGVAADRGLTAGLHAELFLELLSLYGTELDIDAERRALILVTGASVGVGRALEMVGGRVARIANRGLAQRVVAPTMPLITVAGSAGVNIVLTYLVGRRTQAICRGQDIASMDWADTARMVTGLDERKLASLARESALAAWETVGGRIGRMRTGAFGVAQRAGRLILQVGRAVTVSRTSKDKAVKTERAAAAAVEASESSPVKTSKRVAARSIAAPRKPAAKPAKRKLAEPEASPAEAKVTPKAAARSRKKPVPEAEQLSKPAPRKPASARAKSKVPEAATSRASSKSKRKPTREKQAPDR